MQTYVIFSAFGKATDFPILQSLKNTNNLRIICLTARFYKRGWENLNIETHCTFFNPMSMFSRIVRHLFRRRILKHKRLIRLILNTRYFRNTIVVPHNLRHFLALEVLKKINPDDYVFLVDARDLVFQISPVELAKRLSTSSDVQLHEEGKVYFRNGLAQNFQYSEANYDWVQKLLNYPKVEIPFDLNNLIINSGCISGHARNLKLILGHTSNLLSSSHYGIASLLDQAAINVTAYRESEFKSLIKINTNGKIVLNMCGVVEAQFSLLQGKIFLDNSMVPIIHQFDRFGGYSITDGLNLDRRNYEFNQI